LLNNKRKNCATWAYLTRNHKFVNTYTIFVY